jgi:hypothetical protein
MQADVPPVRFRSSFGPVVDRVLIHGGASELVEEVQARFGTSRPLSRHTPYELMVGVTGTDAFHLLGDDDVSFGLTEEARDQILRTFVANNYNRHWREIFAAITTEYTDWYRSVQRPIDLRNDVLDAMSDALFAAPAARFAKVMAEAGATVFFYNFNYQTSGHTNNRKNVRQPDNSLLHLNCGAS